VASTARHTRQQQEKRIKNVLSSSFLISPSYNLRLEGLKPCGGALYQGYSRPPDSPKVKVTMGHTVVTKVIALALCSTIAALSATQENAYKIVYDGGSLQNAKAGTNIELVINQKFIVLERKGSEPMIAIPASAITEISYGQDVHRRVGAAIGLAVVSLGIGALMALTKSKKHFVGITWDDAGQKGGFAFQADKKDYRGVIAGLEGVTGRTAVNSDALTVKN